MTNENESGQGLNATQLDAQRARNLLDRALGLSERNDIAGAIVTCRQSLALAPHSPQGWSMLGLLSERDGDINGAIEAYEKTMQLSPGSVYERESLQRLRQKRGAAPRPAPKFNFDEISSDTPRVPTATAPNLVVPQPISVDVSTEPLLAESSKTFRDTFYFRSLPILIAAIACLGVILVTQRVVANRQNSSVPVTSTLPENVDANTTVAPQNPAPLITPSTLAPPAKPVLQPRSTTTEPAAPHLGQTASPPAAAPTNKPRVETRARPQSNTTPRASVPSELPNMPRPRLNPPSPTSAVSNTGATDNPPASSPTISGGPVDVGNSSDSKYIQVAPPRFPNASRD